MLVKSRRSIGDPYLIGGNSNLTINQVQNLISEQKLATKTEVEAVKSRIDEPDFLVSYVAPIGNPGVSISSSAELNSSGRANTGILLTFQQASLDKLNLWATAEPATGGGRTRLKVTGNPLVDRPITVNFGATAIFFGKPVGVVELVISGEVRIKNGPFIAFQRIWTSRMLADSREGYLSLNVENYYFNPLAFSQTVVNALKANNQKFNMPGGLRFLEVADLDLMISASLFQNSGETLNLSTCTLFIKVVTF